MVHFDALRLPAGENDAIAQNLVQGNGFAFTQFGQLGPTSVRGPVYPMLLAGLDAIFGITQHHAQIAALAINVLASGASVVLAFSLVRSLIGPRGAWIAAVLFAIWPTQIYAVVLVQGLCLAVLLTLIALRLAGGSGTGRAIAAGLVGGIALLTEPILTLPLFFVAIVIGRRRPAHALLLLVAAIMLVGPWVMRNTIVHGRFTGVTDTFWPDAFRGNGPDATGSDRLSVTDRAGKALSQIDRLPAERKDALKAQPEIGQIRLFRDWTIDWIRANPIRYTCLCGERAFKTLWLDWSHPLARQWIDLAVRSIALLGFIAAMALNLSSSTKLMLGAFALGLVLASLLSMAEARTAVLMDIPQLLAVAVCLGQARGQMSR